MYVLMLVSELQFILSRFSFDVKWRISSRKTKSDRRFIYHDSRSLKLITLRLLKFNAWRRCGFHSL